VHESPTTVQEAPARTRPETGTSCPTCGAPAERGQLICLECGSRIALAYRRPPSWRVPAAIIAVIVLATGAGLYFGIDALTDDAEKEVASRPAPPQSAAADGDEAQGGEGGGARQEGAAGDQSATGNDAASDEAAGDGSAGERAEDEGAQSGSGDADGTAEAPTGPGGLRIWPEGEDAFTVVILSSGDIRSARAFATDAAKSGVRAGVLRADDYPALFASAGFYLVFAGVYPNQAKADRAAERLARRFKGAYPQFVDGSKAKRLGEE
jgi:hypothetical protein